MGRLLTFTVYYSLHLFEDIRRTKYVSMFPVGLIRPFGVASPIVSSKTGKVEGFFGLSQRQSAKDGSRAFPGVDMAGFAVSLKVLHEKRPTMPYRATMEEEIFLRGLDLK